MVIPGVMGIGHLPFLACLSVLKNIKKYHAQLTKLIALVITMSDL